MSNEDTQPEEQDKGGRPRKFKSVKEMSDAIDAYFVVCEQKNEPYTMTGLAIALGFESRMSLINYKRRDDGFLDAIKKARLRVEESIERRMIASNGVVAGVIFNAKNNFGWHDKQEIDHTSKGKSIAPKIVSDIRRDAPAQAETATSSPADQESAD